MFGNFARASLRLLRVTLKWIAIVLIVLVAALFVYQRVGLAADAKLKPPADQFVRVAGRAVYVSCTGQGARTFVLDAGAGGSSANWWRLRPALEKAGRVCVFDRPGLGWSDTVDGGHDGVSAADRLHDLVRVAGIARPFVYVGHSLGANFAEIYQSRYPQDVSALVLLEPGDPKDLLEDATGGRAEVMAERECGVTCRLGGVVGHLGVVRLVAHGKSYEGAVKGQYLASVNRVSYPITTAMELGAVPKTAYQCMDVRTFGDTPVLVFASSNTRPPEGKETGADVRRWQVVQRAYLASLSAKSSRGAGLVVVPDSTHVTMLLGQAPAAFIASRIIDFVEAPPAGAPVDGG